MVWLVWPSRTRRRWFGFLTLLAALTVVVALLPAPATGQDDRATVRIDGRAIFRVGPTDDFSGGDRARQIERRLDVLLDSPAAISPARVEPAAADGSARAVTVAGVPVVTVTANDADDNLTTVDRLAVVWADAIDAELQRAIDRRTSWGGRFLAEIESAITAAFARFYEAIGSVVPKVLAASLVLAVFGALAHGVRLLMRLLFRRVVDDLTVENLIKQLAYYAIWAVGLFVAVDALGFNPQTVVAGLGLTGLALGFALKDIVSNFVSGVLILALRPFEIGDQIVVGDTEGGVERIDLRATHVRTYDGRLVLVPNGEVFTSRVTNNTASPVRRGSVNIPVGYDADLALVGSVVGTAVRNATGVLADPPPNVRIGDLSVDGLVVEARYWADSRRSDFTATAAEVRRAIVDGLRAAGVALPDAALHVVVDRTREHSGPPERVAGGDVERRGTAG